MSFDQDPNEQANISGADLAIMIDEMERMRQQNNALKLWDDVFGHLGTPWQVAEEWNRLSDENASLRNRLEAATNGTQAECARAAISAGDKPMKQRDELIGKVNRLNGELNCAYQEIKTEQRLSFRDQVSRLEQQRDELLAAAKLMLPIAKDAMNTMGHQPGMIARDLAKDLGKPTLALERAITKAEANHG